MGEQGSFLDFDIKVYIHYSTAQTGRPSRPSDRPPGPSHIGFPGASVKLFAPLTSKNIGLTGEPLVLC